MRPAVSFDWPLRSPVFMPQQPTSMSGSTQIRLPDSFLSGRIHATSQRGTPGIQIVRKSVLVINLHIHAH
jgi:hypothetical protein